MQATQQLLEQTQSLVLTCRSGEGFADGLQVDDDLIRGQAVPYGRVVQLGPDLFEQFERGAFHRQESAPDRVKLCFRHEEVIGRCATLTETDAGLQFTARISTKAGIPKAAEARALLADDLVDEISIGFQGVPGGMDVARRDDGSTLVTHRRANLAEISLVPWGAYGRNATLQRSRLVDPDELLTDMARRQRADEARTWLADRYAALQTLTPQR